VAIAAILPLLAVEAARCGIWEWDVCPLRHLGPALGRTVHVRGHRRHARLGRRRRRLQRAECWSRIAPEHRERVRQALAAARTYGAFDVSFRVPDRDGRSAWVDARGQAVGELAADGYSRIIGVALDVTEERVAQARAQAAEARLRDAIDSVSEAFVLWDRTGRLVMCNQNYRDFFNLEPRLLKPGARAIGRTGDAAGDQGRPARRDRGLREVR
jgi:two-component system cell cycle sensor histidine kinase PleC